MLRAIHLAGTAEGNRSVVGTMNEFAFLAEAYREGMDLLARSMRLADTPCGAIKYDYPQRLLQELTRAATQLN